jgi:membrane-bound lytic murein transglycosylase B
MQEIPEVIADIARRTGATEDEARLLYCLERAGEAFDGLPNITTGERIQFAVHHQALVNMIAARVVGRDHPAAWGRSTPPEDGPGYESSEPDS